MYFRKKFNYLLRHVGKWGNIELKVINKVNPNKAGLFQKEPRNLKSFTAHKGLK